MMLLLQIIGILFLIGILWGLFSLKIERTINMKKLDEIIDGCAEVADLSDEQVQSLKSIFLESLNEQQLLWSNKAIRKKDKKLEKMKLIDKQRVEMKKILLPDQWIRIIEAWDAGRR